MNISVTTKDLKKALSELTKIVKKEPSLPILKNVLIEQKETAVKLTTTDLDAFMEKEIPSAESAETAKTCMDVRDLYEKIKRVKGNVLTFTSTNNTADNVIEITTEKGEVLPDIELTAFDEYPKTPEIKEQKLSLTLDGQKLAKNILSTLFVIDKNEPHVHFSGVLFEFKKEMLNLVGTDTKQMMVKKYPITNDTIYSAIIPKDSLDRTMKVLKKYKGKVKIVGGNENLVITGDNFKFTYRLIDGVENFPDYNKVVPTDKSKMVNKKGIPPTEFKWLKDCMGKDQVRINFGLVDALTIIQLDNKRKELLKYPITLSNSERLPEEKERVHYYLAKHWAGLFKSLIDSKVDTPVIVEVYDKLPTVVYGEDFIYLTMPLKG